MPLGRLFALYYSKIRKLDIFTFDLIWTFLPFPIEGFCFNFFYIFLMDFELFISTLIKSCVFSQLILFLVN